MYDVLCRLRAEYVVALRGTVRARSAPNDKIPTGRIEVAVDGCEVLNAVSRSLPFPVTGGAPAAEETRLRFRHLDLRRQVMADNLRLRHRVVRALRAVLEDRHHFTEIETPQLTRSTPEGARDFLVPSRLLPGAVYALPQSPQLFKQLLMVSGMDRYYQVPPPVTPSTPTPCAFPSSPKGNAPARQVSLAARPPAGVDLAPSHRPGRWRGASGMRI